MDYATNGALYPRLKSYLTSLPEGADSYPQCQTTSDFTHGMWPQLAPLIAEPSFPQPLRTRLDRPLQSGGWIPATSVVMGCLLLRDRYFTEDAKFAAYIYERGREVYQRPLYRALMFLMSPNLLVIGASKRWASFYKGTELQPVDIKSKNATKLKLTFPPALFPPIYLEALGVTFCAALDCAKAKSPECALYDVTSTSAGFDVRWS